MSKLSPGTPLTSNADLSREADRMGARAARVQFSRPVLGPLPAGTEYRVVTVDRTAGKNSVTLEVAGRYPKTLVTVKESAVHELFHVIQQR